MTDAEKLAEIRQALARVAFPDEKTDYDEYWTSVEVSRDNATDHICGMDELVKELILVIDK